MSNHSARLSSNNKRLSRLDFPFRVFARFPSARKRLRKRLTALPPPPPLTRCTETQRPTGVQIEAQNLSGKKFKMTLDGFEARVFQHEYDHLDGVLFNDRMTDEVRGTIQSKLDALVEKHPEGEEKAL